MNKPQKPKPYYIQENHEPVRSAAAIIKIMEKIVNSSKEEMSPEDFKLKTDSYYVCPVMTWEEKIPDPAYDVNMIKYNADMEAYKKELKQLLVDADKE